VLACAVVAGCSDPTGGAPSSSPSPGGTLTGDPTGAPTGGAGEPGPTAAPGPGEPDPATPGPDAGAAAGAAPPSGGAQPDDAQPDDAQPDDDRPDDDRPDAGPADGAPAAGDPPDPGAPAAPGGPRRDADPVDVVVTVGAWDATASEVQVGAYVADVIEEGGVCTLRLVQGDRAVTARADAVADATVTGCGPLAVGGSALSPGRWTGTVQYASSTSAGQSAPVRIEVP
jgi:hypothetical protein